MAYTLNEMFDLIDIEIKDIDGNDYPNRLKVSWLNRAQDHILGLVNSQYVVSLHTVDTGKAITTGAFATSGLTYTVFRKHLGIMGVKSADASGIFLDPIDFAQYRQLISDGHTFATTKPAYMMRGSSIYVYPTTIASIDVYYMREPLDMAEDVASGYLVNGRTYTVCEFPYINGTTYYLTYGGFNKYDGQTFTATATASYTETGNGTVTVSCELEDDLQDAILEYAMHFGHALNGADALATFKVKRAYDMVQVINTKVDLEHAADYPLSRTAGVSYRPDLLTNIGGR